MKTLWILSLLATLTYHMHLFQGSLYSEDKYLLALRDTHEKFNFDIAKAKQRLELFNQELKRTEGNRTARLQLLRRGLAEERDQLLKLETRAKLSYGLKACRCGNISADLKSKVDLRLRNVSTSIQKLKDDMVLGSTCPLIQQLQSELSREEQYVAEMRDIMQSQCHRPPKQFLPDEPTGLININESRYISDLEKTKWIYGSISIADYKYRMFSLSSKTNLTKCPADKPFTRTGMECISCPLQNPIWSVGDYICTTCPVGQHYNPYGHNCSYGNLTDEEEQATNQDSGNVGGEYGIGFNRNNKGFNYINTPPDRDSNIRTCPKKAPFFNGKRCIACRLPKVFNFDTLSCESCPSGTRFISKFKECSSMVLGKYITNLNATNLMVQGDKTVDWYSTVQHDIKLEHPEIETCPLSKPYFDGEICITCNRMKPYFNLESQECEACDSGFSYFQAVHSCTANIYITNTMVQNIIESDAQSSTSIYQTASKLKSSNPYHRVELCPAERPFAQQFQCISCPPSSPLFNLATKRCTRCPNETTFDPVIKRCRGHFMTNPNAPRLYFKGVTKKAYIEEYLRIKSRDPSIEDCPRETPYFDGSRCVSCALSTPIFSVRSQMCGQCPIGRQFDQRRGDCVEVRNQ